jgi:hypothetical protein
MPSDPGWQPPCSDMIRTPESGSSAIAARIMDTAARLFGVARDRFATPGLGDRFPGIRRLGERRVRPAIP